MGFARRTPKAHATEVQREPDARLKQAARGTEAETVESQTGMTEHEKALTVGQARRALGLFR